MVSTAVGMTDDGKPIYGGSIGMNAFYDRLVQQRMTDKVPFFNALLINFYTILRNCYSKDPKEVELNISKELTQLGTYISDYLSEVLGYQSKLTLPVVIYFPSYIEIQAPIARELSAEMKRLVAMAPIVKKTLLKSVPKDGKVDIGSVVFYFKDVGDRYKLPYHHLDNFLQSLTYDQSSLFKRRSPYLLISHIELDWHVVSQFPNGSLLESYTGRIVPHEEFGDKLIGDKVVRHIPFSPLIHRVFGDKKMVNPLVMRQKKKLMLEAAENWKRKPNSMIISDIARISDNSVGYITSLKL